MADLWKCPTKGATLGDLRKLLQPRADLHTSPTEPTEAGRQTLDRAIRLVRSAGNAIAVGDPEQLASVCHVLSNALGAVPIPAGKPRTHQWIELLSEMQVNGVAIVEGHLVVNSFCTMSPRAIVEEWFSLTDSELTHDILMDCVRHGSQSEAKFIFAMRCVRSGVGRSWSFSGVHSMRALPA
jgi:hypothetical protein